MSNVEHPDHYNTEKYECIDVMLETQGKQATMDFCICNAFKYLWRHNKKNGIEDVKKANWYLGKCIELSETDETAMDKLLWEKAKAKLEAEIVGNAEFPPKSYSLED